MTDPFIGFLILLAIAAVVSAVLHYGLKFYVTPGLSSFFSKVVVAYFGASLGTSVFGAWCSVFAYGDIYILSAILGALAILVVAVDIGKMLRR